MPSIFTKIINREIPCEIIFENDFVLAILDINPLNEGHILVISKKEVKNFLENTKEELSEIMVVAQKIANALLKLGLASGINLLTNINEVSGQTIFHTHFHIIPRKINDGHFVWNTKKYKTEEEKKEIAQKIRESIV